MQETYQPLSEERSVRLKPPRWTRLTVIRYTVMALVGAVGLVQFNILVGMGLAIVAYVCTPFLAHPKDALQYFRRRVAQRRYTARLEAGYGEFIDATGSARQISTALSGEIKPFRLFVSSTFSDLAQERDLLAKEVFPRVAKECERRGAVWAPIDLRWGITEMQQKAGAVIQICLDSVERSRPNTIGIVGPRYGSRLPFTDRDRQSLPNWITRDENLSVTHLELRHATRLDPAGVSVYVLDRAHVANPDDHGTDGMLSELRAVGAHVMDGVRDADRLASLVESDLMRRLEEQVPDLGLENSLLREISAHTSMEQMLASRPRLNAEVLAEAQRNLAEGMVTVLRGESGSGRSTQVAAWAQAWRTQHPDDIVICRFVGLTKDSQTVFQILRSILAELSVRTGQPMRLPPRDDELVMAATFRFLEVQSHHRIALGIDGLDRLDSDDQLARTFSHSLAWLPQKATGTRLAFVPILASDDLREIFFRPYPMAVLDIPHLSRADRLALVRHSLRSVDRNLPDDDVQAIVNHPAAGQPAFLGLLLDELHKVGSHEHLSAALRELLLALTVDELVNRSLDRVGREVGPNRKKHQDAVLALLSESRVGYTEAEIVQMIQQHMCQEFDQTGLVMLRWRSASMISEIDGTLRLAAAFVDVVRRRTAGEEDLQTRACQARVEYFGKEPLRHTPRAILELVGADADIRLLVDIVSDPRGLLALREAYGSSYPFALSVIARTARCSVADILCRAERANNVTHSISLGVAEVSFDYGRHDSAARILQTIARETNQVPEPLMERFFALRGRLGLIGVLSLTDSDWDAIFDHGTKTLSANAQVALSGMGVTAARRGNLFWAKRYFKYAMNAAFTTGDLISLGKASVNLSIAEAEGVDDPLRLVGAPLQKLFANVYAQASMSGDLRLTMTAGLRESVLQLRSEDPGEALEGFDLADVLAEKLDDPRYRFLCCVGRGAAMMALGRRDEGLLLFQTAEVTPDAAFQELDSEVMSLLV